MHHLNSPYIIFTKKNLHFIFQKIFQDWVLCGDQGCVNLLPVLSSLQTSYLVHEANISGRYQIDFNLGSWIRISMQPLEIIKLSPFINPHICLSFSYLQIVTHKKTPQKTRTYLAISVDSSVQFCKNFLCNSLLHCLYHSFLPANSTATIHVTLAFFASLGWKTLWVAFHLSL